MTYPQELDMPTVLEVPLALALRPGYCQRWSVFPELAGSEQHAAHAARVARIILWCWPDVPAAVLGWAITHDDGEMGFGDVSGPAKRENPTLALMLDKAEARNRARLGIAPVRLPATSQLVCDIADKLAGLYHARQVRRDLLEEGHFAGDLADMRRRFAGILAQRSPELQRLRAAFEADFAAWLGAV